MKISLLFYTVILGVMLGTPPGWAQEDNVTKATSSLQMVLSTLKDSVARMDLENEHIASQNKAVKEQVLQLQTQLSHLQSQGDALSKAAAQLQDKNPRREEQIARLEEQNLELDHHIQQTQGSIKLMQESLEAGYQEDQKLLLQLKGIVNAPSPARTPPTPESQAALRRLKEKLKLMKMIDDSQQRQESLHGSILEFQKNTTLLPAAASLAHQQFLKEQIKDLESQVAAYPPEKSAANPGSANQWDNSQLRQLELELKTLEENYQQLKNLMEQMGQKAQNVKITVSQHMEGEKLQGSLDDLNRQGEGLRADLDDLRSQMVDLDKRKSRLEMMIQQLP